MSEPEAKRIKLSDDVRICERFSSRDADLTLESSDKVLFKVHRNNLSVHSCIFPGSELPLSDEIVRFPEESKVLELLLQHIYPDTAPDMDGLEFETLLALADAAEKYHIFSVMEICRLHMKGHADEKPLEVFFYACKYGYCTLSDKTARMTLDKRATEVLAGLGPVHFSRWILYREGFANLYNIFTTYMLENTSVPPYHAKPCHERREAAHIIFTAYHKRSTRLCDMASLESLLDPIHKFEVCTACKSRWSRIHAMLPVINILPKFSEVPFLK